VTTLFIVRSNPVSGREEEFNDWYNNTHLPEILTIDGFKSAQRFMLTPEQILPEQRHQFLAIYEIDSANIDVTLANLKTATWMNMSDAIDSTTMEVSIFSALDDSRKGT